MSDIEDEPPSVLLPCTICSRTFRPEVLSRHVKVCEKTASKKRRVFDSFKNRVSGTELEEFLGPAPLPGQVQKRTAKSPVKKKGPSKWKETHENLIAVLRAARGVQPPPDAMVESSRHGVNEQCPSCNRFFGPRAFDRHVEFCKEKTARIKATPSKVSQAQERLEARTKYRAPLSVKPKLTTKEKYSPMLPRKESTETCPTSMQSTKTSPPIPTLSKNAKNVGSTLGKSNTLRSCERQRSVSPNKKNSVSNSKSFQAAKNDYSINKSSNTPKIKENLRDPDLLRPKTGTKITPQEKLRSSNLRLVQMEDDTPYKNPKSRRKPRENPKAKLSLASDDESIATEENEQTENHVKSSKGKNWWSSSESVNKSQRVKTRTEDRTGHSDDDNVTPKTSRGTESKNDKIKADTTGKSGKKSKNDQKQQLNDLSVNDESFGIFVAPCGQPGVAPRTNVKTKHIIEKPKKPFKKVMVRHSDEEEAIEEHQKPLMREHIKNADGRDLENPKKTTKIKDVVLNNLNYETTTKIKVENEEGNKETVRNLVNEEMAVKNKKNTEKSKVVYSGAVEYIEGNKKIVRQKSPKEEWCPSAENERYETSESVLTSDPPIRDTKMKKPEKMTNSKIPKPKQELTAKISCEKTITYREEIMELDECDRHHDSKYKKQKQEDETDLEIKNSQGMCPPETEDKRTKIKNKARKWQNLEDVSTEDLLHMSEDLDFTNDGEEIAQGLSESAIWEIAAEQFLKSEESITNRTSVQSVDSLNEIQSKNQSVSEDLKKNGDDFIVLHVTDPAKLDENDADMKLSISEPCFPYSDDVRKPRDPKKTDIIIFAAGPNEIIQIHRKRKSHRKIKKQCEVPNILTIREKTFLANDIPKPKRRKLDVSIENKSNLNELIQKFCVDCTENDWQNVKKTFFENLRNNGRVRGEKVYKWHISKDYHFRYLEEFSKSVEDDLKELKNLFNGKKKQRKSYVKEFKRQKLKEKKVEKFIRKQFKENQNELLDEVGPNKKYDYIEINLDDDLTQETAKESRKNCKPKIDKRKAGFELKHEKTNESVELKRDIQKREQNASENGHITVEQCSSNENVGFSQEKSKIQMSKNTPKLVAFQSKQNFCKKTEDKTRECDEIGETYDEKQEIISKNKENHNFHERNRASTPRSSLEPESIEYISPISESEFDITNSRAPQTARYSNDKRNLETKTKTDTKRIGQLCVDDIVSLDRRESRDLINVDSQQVFNNQNSSLENIEEVDEEEENTTDVGSHCDARSVIEIEDFIISKPDAKRILSKEDNCLDGLFPKSRQIIGPFKADESTTAVKLDFTANSVYDLKSKKEKNLKEFCEVSSHTTSRILQKRLKKGCRLPQIMVKNEEKKENSMISLIELWKNKRGNLEVGCNEACKIKATLQPGKLAPLTNKNSFQIKSDISDLYEPFKQAERQMLALLSWPSTTDIKTAKDSSTKTKRNSTPNSNLQSSPTSAFTKYSDNKNDKSVRRVKTSTSAKKNLNETFVNEEPTRRTTNSNNINRQEKPTYTAADDWEQIFEKHFDINRNEMSDKMTNSVKSALDGLLKNTIQNDFPDNGKSPERGRNDLSDNSVIEEILYTSTPKQRNRNKDDHNKSLQKTANSTYGLEDLTGSLEKLKRGADKRDRNSGVSLSSLSFCSQISDTTLADEEVMRSNLEIIGKTAAISRTPRRKYARSQSVFEERNRMLFAKTYDANASSSEDNEVDALSKIYEKRENKSPTRTTYPKPVPSHFYRSQSVYDSRFKGDGDHTDDGEHISSPESTRNRKAKLSGDSAYSSLNRRSPRRENLTKNIQEDRLSSSGSDTSLQIINDEYDAKVKPSLDHANKKNQPVKMSKFCHECGSKYPVAVAKFCCECGVRRLII